MANFIERSGFKTEYTYEPVCPWCGKEVSDAWELEEELTEDYPCGWCDKPMNITRHILIYYSTEQGVEDAN